MRQLVLIAHNVRSTHNVGSLLRTTEGLGVQEVILTGYTPYPLAADEGRLPHLAQKLNKQIAKTALGAEKLATWRHIENIEQVIVEHRGKGYQIIALEQAKGSISLPDFKPDSKVAIIVGREVEGLEPEVLKLCDATVEIPMFGKKESFNVVQAAAMALYHLRFIK